MINRFLQLAIKLLTNQHFQALIVFIVLSFLVVGRGVFANREFNSADLIFDKTYWGGDGAGYNNSLTDSGYLHLPRYQYFWDELRAGNWSNYIPHVLTGVPSLAFPIGQFILSWPIFFTNSIPTGLTIATFTNLALAGYLMYWVLRQYKVTHKAALLAGILWMLNANQIVWLQFPTHLTTQVWLPLLALLIDRTFRKPNFTNWFFTWLITWLFINSGYIQLALYFLLIAGGVIAFRSIYNLYRTKEIKPVLISGLTLLSAIGLATVMSLHLIINTNNLIDRGLRGEQVFSDRKCLVCDVTGVKNEVTSFISPDLLGTGFENAYVGPYNPVEYSRYIGLIPLLSFLFIPLLVKRKKLILGLSTTLFGIYVVMVELPPFIQIFNLIPFVESGRVTRLNTLLVFILILIAALIWDELIKNGIKTLSIRSTELIKRGAALFVGLGLTALMLLNFPNSLDRVNQLLSFFSKQETIVPEALILRNAFFIVAGLILTYILITKLLYKQNINKVFTIIILFMIFDLGRVAFFFNTLTPRQQVYPEIPIINQIHQDQATYRIAITQFNRFFLPPNIAMYYGYEVMNGYSTTISTTFLNLLEAGEIEYVLSPNGGLSFTSFYKPLMDMLNVKYIVVENAPELQKPDLSLYPNIKEVYRDEAGTVYLNEQSLSRIFLSRGTVVNSDYEQLLADMKEKNFAAEDYTWFQADPGRIVNHDESPGIISDIQNYTESISATANVNYDSWLVFSQAYDSKWELYIDEQPQKLTKVNGIMMAAYIPAGEHQIKFIYNDKFLTTISWFNLSILSVVCLIWLIRSWLNWDENRRKELLIIGILLGIILIQLLPIVLNKQVKI